tara:strand:+ start:1400 stop:1831 length:432 start_codon:yes stop_codon:yes gene_type:complete
MIEDLPREDTAEEADPTVPDYLEIVGRRMPAMLPPSVAVREELADLWVRKSELHASRIAGAFLGTCCPSLAAQAGVTLRGCGFDLFVFGGGVYDYLRSKGLTRIEVFQASLPFRDAVLVALFPRESEVSAQVDFIEAGGGGST